MRTDIPTLSPLVTSDDFTITNIGMDESGMAKACVFLRDKIYTDKILATVRETITNAIDEHVKHNVDRPVETGIRRNAQNKYEFFVRDFAKGLSDDSLRNIFGMYFRSTKSNSNAMIGGFGLGAKAPSCYNDTFYVDSYFEGIKTSYAFTMGADESGSSVVQILDIGREETTESGLEVFIEVKPSDVNDFNTKIHSLVKYCNVPIEYKNHYGDTVVPLEATTKITKNGYVFKFYPSDTRTFLQMGNVCYEMSFDYSILGQFSRHTYPHEGYHTVVVDIPIGKMSLPISRESFEVTSANTRVREEIKAAYAEIIKEDLVQFEGKTLLELIAEKNEQVFKGNIFSQHKSVLYPDTYEFLSRLGRCNQATIDVDAVEILNGKKLVALIPDKRTADMWHSRLTDKAIEQNKSYYYITDSLWHRFGANNVEITTMFIAKKVNSRFFGLGYSASAKDDKDVAEEVKKYHTPYTVRTPGSYRRRYHSAPSYTALQLHNKACVSCGLEEADDVDAAKEQMKKLREQGESFFSTIERINYFTISKDNSHQEYWTTASQKLHDALVSIGWISYDISEDYTLRGQFRAEVIKREKEARELLQNISSAMPSFIKHSHISKVQRRLQTKPHYAKKMTKIIYDITHEDSSRARLLKTISKASIYYDADKLTRDDLRKILNLK